MTTAFQNALANHQIMPAPGPDGQPFLLNGLPLYMATDDGFNLSIGRFHAFGDLLRRHDELRLSSELLDAGFAALEGLLRRIRAQLPADPEQVLDAVGEGLVILDRLKQRQALGLSVEQVYEIASIFYFTEEEELAVVDWTINRAKIQTWLKADNAGALYRFFLNSPIANYIPLAGLSDTSILNYLREENVVELLDWTRVLLRLRTDGATTGPMNTIEYRRETLYGLDGLLRELSPITSTTGQPGNGPNSEN